MKRLLMLVVVSWTCACAATTYYVSSRTGDDGNDGRSSTTAWKTLASVSAGGTHAALIVPGTTVLLARGDVWQEPLVPGSSGASGNPIIFDAYGTGAAPEITGSLSLAAANWTQVSGYTNQWSAPVTATGMNYVLFGTIWGTRQSSQAAVQHDRDFYFSGSLLYVYAPANPATYYGSVSAMLMTGAALLSVNGKQWLTFQHLRLDWFDAYGVSVTGASDHLVFANMEVDGMIPAGALPQGFYFNASNPGDISLFNDAFHMNYDGVRVDGTASKITVENCAGYANRDSALVDNTGGHLTYSYSHFYGNGTGAIELTDVQGAVELGGAGNGHNIASDTAPSVEGFARYAARFSFTVDDVGIDAGADTFVDTLVQQVFDPRGLQVNVAVVAGATGVSYSVSDVASWIADGHEVDSHSWSHQYFTDPQAAHGLNNTNPTPATAFSLKYVGAGTAATASFDGTRLTTSVTGGPGGQNLNLDLSSSSYDTLGELTSYITNNYAGVYTVTTWTTPLMRIAAHSKTLATFTSQDIKTSAYGLQFDPTRAVTGLMADEAKASRDWLQGNVAGLSNVKVYVYPDGVTDPAFEGAVAAAGYEGARGTLSMCVSGMAPCAGTNGFVSYATGVNAQNMTSLTPFGWSNYVTLTQRQLDAKVAALIFRMRVWGYPVGLFVHWGDYSQDMAGATQKTGWLLDSIAAHGGSVMRNDALIETVLGMQGISGTTKYVTGATGEALSFRPTAAGAGVGKGKSESAAYAMDLAGTSRPALGAWDVGPYQILWTKHGVAGAGHFTMGGPGAATAPLGSSWFPFASTSTADPGNIVAPFTSTAPTATTCSGDCQNAFKEDTSIPGHVAGTENITRMTDGRTVQVSGLGGSIGGLTCSSGDNDRMISANGTYAAFAGGGAAGIYHLRIDAGPPRHITVINAGVVPALSMTCPGGFSPSVDTRFYQYQSNGELIQRDITDNGGNNMTTSNTTLVNLLTYGVCPGIPSGFNMPPQGIAHITTDGTDDQFSIMLGAQATAYWVVAWSRTKGCSTSNWQTGQAWAFCKAPSICNDTTPPVGTFGTGVTNCWAGAGQGIHDEQMTGDGQWMTISQSGTWKMGECYYPGPPATSYSGYALWQVGTANNVWCQNQATPNHPYNYACGAHQSMGISKLLTPGSGNSGQGPTIHNDLSNPANESEFYPQPQIYDFHCSWPHRHADGSWGDDMPWICAGDSVTVSGGTTGVNGCASAVYCPKFQANAVWAVFPQIPNKVVSFFHTYACAPSAGFAQCSDGLYDGFGASNAIGVASPKGDFFCWVSGMLHQTGTDNAGHPRNDAYCGLLE